jgi:hypothetical protein
MLDFRSRVNRRPNALLSFAPVERVSTYAKRKEFVTMSDAAGRHVECPIKATANDRTARDIVPGDRIPLTLGGIHPTHYGAPCGDVRLER